jgi:ABC-type proline/glycine betaine transport system permease subunit
MEKKASDFYLKHHAKMKGRKSTNSQWLYKHPLLFVASLFMSLLLPIPLGIISSVLYMENNRRFGIWVLLSTLLGIAFMIALLLLLFFGYFDASHNLPDNW